MYNNSGAKVKGLASFFAGLGMVCSIIAGIVTMIGGRGFGGFLGGVIVAAVGCLGAWLGGLMMAAFGELVQNSYEILQLLKNGAPAKNGPLTPGEAAVKVTQEEIDYVAKRDNLPYVEAVIQAKKEKSGQTAAAPAEQTVPVENTAPAEKICPACGTVNKAGKFCFKCGTKL